MSERRMPDLDGTVKPAPWRPCSYFIGAADAAVCERCTHPRLDHFRVELSPDATPPTFEELLAKAEDKRVTELFRADYVPESNKYPWEIESQAEDAAQIEYLNPGLVLRRSPFRNAAKVKTGLPTLDDWTEGGIPYGATVGISGPPGSGKTSLAIQLAREAHEQHGAAVTAAFYDEGTEGAALKLGQQIGLDYERLRASEEEALVTLEEYCLFTASAGAFQFVPLTQELVLMLANARRDKIRAHPLVLLTDTLQKARFELDDPQNGGERFRIERMVMLLRDAALTIPALNIATSEVSRGAYASKDPSKRTAGLAAGAESRAIEYGCELLLVLSNRADGLINVEVAKNRVGRGRKGHLVLRQDRDRALYTEVDRRQVASERENAEKTALGLATDTIVSVLRANREVNSSQLADLCGGNRTMHFKAREAAQKSRPPKIKGTPVKGKNEVLWSLV